MDVEVGDTVRLPNGTEGRVLEFDAERLTALIEISGGIVGRFEIQELRKINPAENNQFHR